MQHRRPADIAARTGDQRDLALKFTHDDPPSILSETQSGVKLATPAILLSCRGLFGDDATIAPWPGAKCFNLSRPAHCHFTRCTVPDPLQPSSSVKALR